MRFRDVTSSPFSRIAVLNVSRKSMRKMRSMARFRISMSSKGPSSRRMKQSWNGVRKRQTMSR